MEGLTEEEFLRELQKVHQPFCVQTTHPFLLFLLLVKYPIVRSRDWRASDVKSEHFTPTRGSVSEPVRAPSSSSVASPAPERVEYDSSSEASLFEGLQKFLTSHYGPEKAAVILRTFAQNYVSVLEELSLDNIEELGARLRLFD